MAYKDPLDPRARASRLRHYYKNRKQYYARNKKLKAEMLVYVNKLKNRPCMDCRMIFHHSAMDFDHRDDKKKFLNVSLMTSRGSWNKLLLEIEKCDIVCSNCHRVRTFNKNQYIRKEV